MCHGELFVQSNVTFLRRQTKIIIVRMGEERKDGFLQNLIFCETKETINELKKCLERDQNLNVSQNSKICKFINQYLETIENSDTEPGKEDIDQNYLNENEILRFIEIILDQKLDFNNRLDGSRNVLDQWQKTRAFKNEAFSVQSRETGNENLRNGQLSNALRFYNEAVLFGWFN